LNIPIGDRTGGVQAEQALIGQQSGTNNILFSTEPAQMLSADAANVTAYHEHMDRLTRLIYRLSVVAWESDSRDSEAADSRRIKRDDMDQVLAGYADECRRVDLWAADLSYRAAYGEAYEGWQKKDGLTIKWPETFTPVPLEDTVAQFAEAVALDLGETATKALKKRAARAVLPDESPETLKAIDDDINAMDVPTAEEKRQQDLELATQKVAGAFGV
jgi:hypothetical protein